ncbi:TerD family protein [Streptomyces sp. J2-1]|uniref:TerD family protein n=1 Tax=Streptomyces corallincola TaxID=2851888 RepID=UPI001C381613|nr:TerD family protein [Streptomyces corallincola]MBV2357037.1 TerD family protein [Streptomyces corallincola]
MAGVSKGIRKVEASLKWDPSPVGGPPTDLDLVAGTYLASDPYGAPDYLVHFDSRSPDGTIFLNRDSTDGKGFGWDEVMTLELERLAERYARVVVGAVIQQQSAPRTFSGVLNPAMRVREGYTVLAEDEFAQVAGATAAVLARFDRDSTGAWTFRPGVLGFQDDPATFTRVMGGLGRD